MAPNTQAASPIQGDVVCRPCSGMAPAASAVFGTQHINKIRKPIEWAKKNWLLPEPEDIHHTVLTTLTDEPWLEHTSHAESFSKLNLTAFVYTSNALERTLPAGVEQQQTYRILEELVTSGNDACMFEEPSATWSADGDVEGRISCSQFVQHLRAAKYLFGFVDKPLTVDVIKQTHKLLMAGAVDEGNLRVKAGEFRDHPCHADWYQFPKGDPEELRAELTNIVNNFNESIRVRDSNTLITAPARLFYDTITLHPFQDGNGRLCRLLFAFAVSKAGVPFPVQLSTGHRKARKHYMRAIFRARRGKMDELHTMTLMSINDVLCKFAENIRVCRS